MENNNDLEKLAQELQEQIMEQIKKRYSQTVIDLWQNPKDLRKMDSPEGYAKVQGSCGDTMEMFLKMKDGIISECSFFTDGCGTTIACGSAATQMAFGKSFTEALANISADAILKQLGGLPKEDIHCAQLAAETLRRALADRLYQKQHLWKKQYRKT
ncbi:MAG: iron-sulfur cluster assembly scaffold protein [Candidatus Aminicenantes bacterium]|jgi:nitrogen fixation NifU-like protein